MWDKVFKMMAEGKIPYSPTYYSIPIQDGSGDDTGITLVSPTEQQVQIAKSEAATKTRKRKVEKQVTVNKKPKPYKSDAKGKGVKPLPKKLGGKGK